MKTVLVTGGAGYIGSHTVLVLQQAGYHVVVIDNLNNASAESLRRVTAITGKEATFVEADVRDAAALNSIFSRFNIDSVIHFAGLKAVGESVQKPLDYYENNLDSTFVLLRSMKKHGVNKIVFSSSATVYGVPDRVPITEDFPLSATNPYGRTKLFLEYVLRDAAAADAELRVSLLRYFNPAGAHPSGTIGEDPSGIPNNLMPFITQVAVGRREKLSVFGGDYPTHDGTGVRDYIHVMDLAEGHLAALRFLDKEEGVSTFNLGTGKGYSVLDMVKAFEKSSGKQIPFQIVDRRPGDVAACYADPAKAAKELGWTAKRSLEEMCADSWRWQEKNPNGFR